MSTKERVNLEREIPKVEKEAVKAKEKLAKLRRRLPALEVEDYSLVGAGGEKVTLSSVFGEKDELILIHNMGKKCPYCTMVGGRVQWRPQAPGEPRGPCGRLPRPPGDPGPVRPKPGVEIQAGVEPGTALARDLGFQGSNGGYRPGVSVLRKERDGTLVRVSRARFGRGDDFSSVFSFFDLLPDGVGDWRPRFTYR